MLTRPIAGADAATRLFAAAVPTVLFAFQPILLAEATAGEVNSWSTAWVCVAAYVFVRLHAALDRPGAKGAGADRRGAVLWGLVCGAGVAHHLTSILVAAPMTIALAATAMRRRRAPAPLLLVAMLAACVPIASYGIIAWRAWHPAVVQWPALVPSLASVVDHITGGQYRHYIGYFAPAPDHRALIDKVVAPFLTVGFVALLASLLRAREAGARTLWAALLAGAALVTAFTFRYGVPDPAPYFLPAMALGAVAAAPALAALAAPLRNSAGPALGVVALAAVVLAATWARDGAAQRRDVEEHERLIRSMWAAVPPDTAIVFWPDDRYIHLREYQLLLGEKPALTVLCPDLLLEDRTRADLTRRFGVDPIAGHPVPHIVPGSPDADLRIRQYFKEVIRSFNERIRTPVIVFDPSVPIVQRQRKPWEGANP